LFDEPLSNLDAALRVRMRYEFARLHQDLKTTMVYVTHDQVEAMTLADRIVVLSAGKIEQVGSPLELYDHPENLFVAGFIGSPRMNFIAAELSHIDAGCATVVLASGESIQCQVDASAARAGDKVTLGIRPEHLRTEGTANRIGTTVTFVESLGSSTHAYCALAGAGDALTCELDDHTDVRHGETLTLSVPASLCYLFDATGKAFTRLAPPVRQRAH
jgi:multiple sugar transport system ATP-binding protein